MSSRLLLRNVCLGSLLTLCLTGTFGCRCYHSGSIMHPQIKTLAVGKFENRTYEPRLSALLRQKLAENFMTDGSIRVASMDNADVILHGIILTYQVSEIAAAKMRDENERERDSDAYQSAIFRVGVEVEFEVVIPGRERPVIAMRKVRGTADFSRLPDLNLARQQGFKQALNEAALEMVTAVTEAW